VGFDDLAFARFVRPALTTVHTDKYGQGRTLVDVLLTAGPPRRIVLPASLITRDSA
jgi:DNA-binding LacI/PurR family transcriptional regulator